MSERYQVRGRVGRGGMSAVFRAFDTVMGREVALKRLLPVEDTNLNEPPTDLLAREAAALARFQHPNVVTIFAIEEDDEGPFVVMELVEGEDLHSIMKTGVLSWEDFRDVAQQCLEPLIAAGELNLLHRDIKPGNIMLTATASGRSLVKLLDFGLAKFSQQPSLQTLDQKGSFLGSIEFIAPEQLELLPLDPRTDLYSLGCVFYYMLAQISPFSGSNPAETSMNHIRHRCKPISEIRTDIPPLVADWIMRLISRQPRNRPSDAKEALRQFQEALKGIPFDSGAKPAVKKSDEDLLLKAKEPPPVGPGTVARVVVKPGSSTVPKGRMIVGPVLHRRTPQRDTLRQVRHPRLNMGITRRHFVGPNRRVWKPPVSGYTLPENWKLYACGGISIVLLIVLGILALR